MKNHERLSYRLSKFIPSLTLQLKAIAEARRGEGKPVWDFGLGETLSPLDDTLKEAGVQAFRQEQTMYTNPAGLPALREEVLSYLGLADHYAIEDVVISCGAKGALFNVFMALCNPADSVLLDCAPWVSYQPLAHAAYAHPVMVLPKAGPEGYLKITPDDLRRNLRFRPHSRLFLLNNPVNPTAQLYTNEEVEALFDVCLEHRVYFVLDRLYWRIVYDGKRFPEPDLTPERKKWLIQIDGLSKNFSRGGGLRVGWSVAPRDVSEAMVSLQSHYTAGPATPSQQVALAGLRHPDVPQRLTADLQRKRDLLRQASRDMPFVRIWPSPATFYSFWDVRPLYGRRAPAGGALQSSDDVARYLLESEGIVCASGSAFLQDGFLRFSFAVPDETITGGMRAARRALEALA